MVILLRYSWISFLMFSKLLTNFILYKSLDVKVLLSYEQQTSSFHTYYNIFFISINTLNDLFRVFTQFRFFNVFFRFATNVKGVY